MVLFPFATSGYIFSPIADLITGSRQYTLLCEYPVDAFSDSRSNQGCGYDPEYPPYFKDFGCSNAGVNTSDEYVNAVKAPVQMCSASPDQAGFKMMLETNKKLKTDNIHNSLLLWNELVIQEWSNKKSEDVPIEAFFYEIKNDIPNTVGKSAADSAAQLYHKVTGIDVPVVAVDVNKLVSGDETPFSNEIQ